jgi:hypothetical protein
MAYYSTYSGKEIDEAVTWTQNQKQYATSSIIDSSNTTKIDLNTLITTEGTFTIYWYTNGYSDADGKTPINIKINLVGNTKVIQTYVVSGDTVQREYTVSTKTWTSWKKVNTFVELGQSESISVNTDTIAFRKLTNSADKFFAT